MKITLSTKIIAPIGICFDLARSADIHLLSTKHTNEKAIAGRRSGLFELDDEVTWEAIHLGVKQRLSTRITQMEYPHFFEDTMLKGAFKSMRHEHLFEDQPGITIMTDNFFYEVPLGWMGRIFDFIYLKGYMTKLLQMRNSVIKKEAEHGIY